MSISQPQDLELGNSKPDFELLSRLGDVSKKRRIALGLSTVQLSEQTEIDFTHLTEFEVGNWDIDILSLHSLSRSLNTTAVSLLKESERNGVPN
jgi:transcriptional regulator with XRE-family HTH domain